MDYYSFYFTRLYRSHCGSRKVPALTRIQTNNSTIRPPFHPAEFPLSKPPSTASSRAQAGEQRTRRHVRHSLHARPSRRRPRHYHSTTSAPALIESADIFLEPQTHPFSPCITPVLLGSQLTDGGNLIVEATNYPRVAAAPIAAKYLYPFHIGRAVFQGLERWCPRMHTEHFNHRDIDHIPVLKERA